MSKRFKPKVRLTAGAYRIVETDCTFGRLEVQDGRDAMGVMRWKDHDPLTTSAAGLARVIGQKLATTKRKKRRTAR